MPPPCSILRIDLTLTPLPQISNLLYDFVRLASSAWAGMALADGKVRDLVAREQEGRR
jgi:hypothetical protein